MKINPQFLQQQISNTLLDYPVLKDDEQLRADTLEGQTDLKETLTAILHKIDEDEMMATGIEERMLALGARHERVRLRVSYWRAVILKIMQWTDLKRLELPEATLSQRAGAPKLIGNPDVSLLPEELVKVTRQPNRVAIKEALLRGDIVPECSLSNAEPTLAIHTK